MSRPPLTFRVHLARLLDHLGSHVEHNGTPALTRVTKEIPMTQQRLTWLADALRAGGLKVVEIDGWKTRSRPLSTGGFNPVGVLWHHTGDSGGGLDYAKWLANVGRSDLPAPLCQLSVARDGTVYVIAAGRANHAGVAKPSGSVAGGDGNSLYIGIECQNNGAEGWKPAQYGAMVKVGAVLGKRIPCTINAQRGHKETSVTGKWDPGALDMDKFRADIARQMRLNTAPAPAPVAEPTKQPATRVLKGATWNLRVGRNPNKVLAELLEFLDEFDIDVMTVVEAAGYVRSLRRPLRRHGYTLQAFPRLGGSARDSAVIVRKGLTVRRKWLHRLETTGWKKGHGRPGLHWPRSAVSVGVERIRVVAVHQAPGPFGGAFASRGVANEAGFATLTRLARRWNRRKQAWVMAGDWNRRIGDPVAGQFAKTTGAALLGHGIDWVASRGVKVTAVAEHKFGTSDHNPKTFTITR